MKVSSSEEVHDNKNLINIKQAQAMIELFSKQGVSIPITTNMVWEAYKQVKQGGRSLRRRWHDMGISAYPSEPSAVQTVGAPCVRKLFSTKDQGSEHSKERWQPAQVRFAYVAGQDSATGSSEMLRASAGAAFSPKLIWVQSW